MALPYRVVASLIKTGGLIRQVPLLVYVQVTTLSMVTTNNLFSIDLPKLTRRGRSKSLNLPMPTVTTGIPLGTLTAKLASKSFWTGEMLDETLRQVSHTVLKEVNIMDLDCGLAGNEIPKEKNERNYDQKTPCVSLSEDGCPNGFRTPPYLSPNITRKLRIRGTLSFEGVKKSKAYYRTL